MLYSTHRVIWRTYFPMPYLLCWSCITSELWSYAMARTAYSVTGVGVGSKFNICVHEAAVKNMGPPPWGFCICICLSEDPVSAVLPPSTK